MGTGATSSDNDSEANESEAGPTSLATTTWPISRRRSVKWCDVTDDESYNEMDSMLSRGQKTGSALTLLQSTFAERAMDQSVCVKINLKNTFIEVDESPIAARMTRS